MIILFSIPSFAQDQCNGDLSLDHNIAELTSILSSEQASECEAPKPGTFKDIDIDPIDSPTGIEHRYRLKRNAVGDFEVSLNVTFFRDDGSRKRRVKSDEELTKTWREKVAKCLRNIDGQARGPNGEMVLFRVYDGPDSDHAPPPAVIGIRKSGRAHSRSWTEDLGCSGITHELLHLTGLVDEYPESAMGYVKDPATGKWTFVQSNAERSAFDCRKLYEKNSIMAQHLLAWSDSRATWDLRIDFCVCSQSDGCKDFFEDQKRQLQDQMSKGIETYQNTKIVYPTKCAAGFERSENYLEFGLPDEIKKQYDEGKPFGFAFPKGITADDMKKMTQSFTFSRRSAAAAGNILEPRHFNAIIFPGCLARNRQYYEDSANAYRTSRKNGGKGCADLSWSTKAKE